MRAKFNFPMSAQLSRQGEKYAGQFDCQMLFELIGRLEYMADNKDKTAIKLLGSLEKQFKEFRP
jgi:hypothetical protein